MNHWDLHRRTAVVLGAAGGALGVVVGTVQATVGTRIPEWTGNKADPVALGLLTVLLSVVGLSAAAILHRSAALSPQRRLAAAAGLLIPGGLCFSTGGALWFVPGALLCTGGVYSVIAGSAHRTRKAVSVMWCPALVSVLGAYVILMAVSASPTLTVVVGLTGGAALMVAPWLSSAGLRWSLLLIGTVPFAVVAWWSVAAPVVSILALLIAVASLRIPVPTSPPTAGGPEARTDRFRHLDVELTP